MTRYLVVANRTLLGGHLLEVVAARAAEGEASFHLVVPATPPSDHAWSEGECRAAARSRLQEGLTAFGDAGLAVTGEVGDANPVHAIVDAMNDDAHGGFDEIILSTLPPGPSRWLHQDVPHRVARRFPRLRVTHVVAERALAK